jgi:prolyl oligopeptidase
MNFETLKLAFYAGGLMRRVLFALMLCLPLSVVAQHPKLSPPPPTPKKPVVDTYFGTKVVDNYQWLEKNDPQVREWTDAQNERSRSYMDALRVHPEIVDWLKKLMAVRSVSYYEIEDVGGKLFALKSQPGKQQDLLVTMDSPNDPASEHVVVDPTVIDPSGNTAIQFFTPSLDGKFVAVCLSQGGSEQGAVHVYDTATGKALSDVIPRVNFPTGGGSVAWNADGSGFYFTRYPHEGERPPQDLNFYQQVYFHKLGTPESQDTYVIGKDFPRIAEISLESGEGGRYLLVIVANGDGGQYEHFLRDPQGKWTQITHFDDQVSAGAFGPDQALYVVSRKDAPRGKMLRLPLASPELQKATVVIPQSTEVIQGFRFALSGFPANYVVTKDRIYVVDLVGGPTEIRVYDHSGHDLGKVPAEAVSTVSHPMVLKDGEVLFTQQSYTTPPGWYAFNPQTKKTQVTALHSTSPVSFSDVEVTRETAVSKDGTKVPLTILHKKGMKLDGSHPAVLTGYGGFDISISPGFDPALAAWLDSGGVWAIANLRGGGEFGEQWHEAGMGVHKQNVFNDFIACSEHLIKQGYTNPKQFGIEGGSNGGLLMGAVLTQRPDLYRAVVSVAGLYDMLRYETTQNGQFNVTEYGSVQTPRQFKALYAYSPYQHVKDGTKYPAVLLMIGQNDLRVDPWHSKKFAAALQAASTSQLPVLLLSFSNAGHGGIGASENEEVAMRAYEMSFFYDQLNVPFTAPPLMKAAAPASQR